MIRNASTKQFRAVTALRSQIRWCLTDTPIQNSLEDLGSLVTFLELPILGQAPQFRRFITNTAQPTKSNRRRDFTNLHILLESICLRRNKSVLCLPQTTEHMHELDFTPDEREGYNRLLDACAESVRLAVNGHKMEKKRQTVLKEILRPRLFCNHGNLFDTTDPNFLSRPDVEMSLLQQSGEAVYYYCSCDVLTLRSSGDSGSGRVTQCRRVVCGDCVARYKVTGPSARCPICHALHEPSSLDAPRDDDHGNVPSDTVYPSKLQKLCEDICAHKHEGKRWVHTQSSTSLPLNSFCSIVFSFWKKSLELVGQFMDKHGVFYLRLDGSLPFSKRTNVLSEFQVCQEGTVLLMTLGTGAVGYSYLFHSSVARYNS